ncbi:hypothetical protein LCGC14_1548380 [marine sediment metagenome]|uniref:Uncharacterized protein n=1 Tax=marine sediment metagenome TaxID=412755 RepID=A0A0F9L726_9ZZZZ
MKIPGPKSPEEYKDVKANLRYYTTFIIVILSILLYIIYIGIDPGIVKTIEALIFSSVIIFLLNGLSWALIFIFEIHDKWYDRHFVKWRLKYDVDFIIPTLIRPFLKNIDPRFFDIYENNLEKRFILMENCFYEFVGDHAGENKIKKTKIVRFYESSQKYWITQINEIIMIFFIIINFFIYIFNGFIGVLLNKIIIVNFIFIFLFIINRYLVKKFRKETRFATKDEIREIHATRLSELEVQVKLTHKAFQLPYP